MILLDRWTEIVNYLRNRKFATVEELMNEFNISRSTLRRDLIAMEERKLIVRTRGGAQIVEDAEDNYANYSLDNIWSFELHPLLNLHPYLKTIVSPYIHYR